MENQHREIKGYRELSQPEIDLMNDIKAKAEDIGNFIEFLGSGVEIDLRWLAIARTNLQVGFMELTRAVAKPESF